MASRNASYIDARSGTFYTSRTVDRDQFHTVGRDQSNKLSHPLDPFELLAPVDAAYNRNGPIAKCLQGTREQLIATIVRWIDGDRDRPICWLNGPAGSGKSAVSQTVAEFCDAHHRLAASFFFLRGAGDRSRIARLIPTLAYQLSISIPATKPFIQQMLRKDPLIVRQALHYQFQKLVIEPILAVTDANFTTTPMVIFVDALDECDDKDLMVEFVEIAADAYRRNPVFPLRFFFTSRMEKHLRKIEASEARSVIHHLALQDFDAANDIHKFFRYRFATIYEENYLLMQHVPRPWPSHADLDALVQNASGSFLFASTLINFVDNGTGSPHLKLPKVLAAHASLDPLYIQVLSTAPRGQVLRRIIGTILFLRSSLSITSLGHLLQLDTADVLEALLGVQSILMIPENDDEPVRLVHTSLRDFLTSKPRSGDFFIDPARHLDILVDCLKFLAKPPETGTFFAGEASIYACINWCHHFDQWLTIGGNLLDLSHDHSLTSYLRNFVSQSFDYWLDTLLKHGVLQDILRVLRLVLLKLEVSLFFLGLGNGLTTFISVHTELPTRSATDYGKYRRACKGNRFAPPKAGHSIECRL
ncbi:hypothetical protein PILCRDRAFT_750317 [Piloderma croceum F 1598]|uniref:Nephrocystin 3-like N-terminal domain-containing protein n=1 Tax=Piloderma croceum (strain F 1598) TaxID=765440 RepID=A0A0C3EUJ0_PILCF|nr:hypothetical protein PILCRDRAFT_750317 [Piloderma croceum F 1598]